MRITIPTELDEALKPLIPATDSGASSRRVYWALIEYLESNGISVDHIPLPQLPKQRATRVSNKPQYAKPERAKYASRQRRPRTGW